jgi:hypothetical protein
MSANGKKGIVAIVPRGEVIRNFEYSGTFEAVAKEVNLTLLSVNTNSQIDLDLKAKFGNVFPLTEYDESWIVRFQRELLDVAHGRWLWSRAAQERWRLRDREAETTVQKTKRLAKKTISLPLSNKNGLKLLSKTERVSSRILNPSSRYLDLYKRLRPSLVFNGSHIHSRNAIQAVQSAQWLGISTATFIYSWDNLTSQGRITLPYDFFLVWNEALKVQLLEMYDRIKPESVFVTGTPQFDFHFRTEYYQSREDFCRSLRIDPNRPFIFYATGMPNHMPGEPEIVEGIAEMLEEYDPTIRPQLLVRVYPKDRTGRFDDLKNRRKDIHFPSVAWEPEWLTPKFEDTYALVNTLRHCSVGINVASTVSLELCMFGKPVINVGYNPESVAGEVLSYADYYEFDHYKPVVASGAVQVARSKDEMRELIREALSDPDHRDNERKKLIRQMFGETLDGNSGKRVADILLQLAEKN